MLYLSDFLLEDFNKMLYGEDLPIFAVRSCVKIVPNMT